MRVLIVNTSERTGGAAVAANRLMEALNNHGVKARMLVRDKESDSLTVIGLSGKWWQQWCFLWERLVIYQHLHFSRRHLFELDIANVGTDITKLHEFREADVIHLHWVNQGMLSLNIIRKILRSGKPVVWTMHDIWPATSMSSARARCAVCGMSSPMAFKDASSANTFAGVPSATSFPWFSRMTRLQNRARSSMLCDTRTSPRP